MRRRAFNPYGLPVMLTVGTGNSLTGDIPGAETGEDIDYSSVGTPEIWFDEDGTEYTFYLYDGIYWFLDPDSGWITVDINDFVHP